MRFPLFAVALGSTIPVTVAAAAAVFAGIWFGGIAALVTALSFLVAVGAAMFTGIVFGRHLRFTDTSEMHDVFPKEEA